MKNRELINALIEHYAECGESEVELIAPDNHYYAITYVTETHALKIKETGGYCRKCNHYACDHGSRGCNIDGCRCQSKGGPKGMES